MSDAQHTLTRREALLSLAAVTTTAVLEGCVGKPPRTATPPIDTGAPMSHPSVLTGQNTVVPLPFDARAVVGLSERLLVSHHENNYGGAVKNLNRVEQELASIGADTPAFVVAALRERELMFRNSKSLHELYFGNLGGDGRAAGGIANALADAYGSLGRWEEHFRATGLGLGGGSGWVVLALELDTGLLRTIGSGHHTQTLAIAAPLLVMDMYEHAYQIDFGAAAARYVDAFMAAVAWDEVERRYDRAVRAAAVLRGA
jgi:Fe-Mn family superoxide dismutase